MAIDYSVHLPCDVKRTLGDDDALAGEGALLELLKAQGRAKTLKRVAAEQGRDVETMTATLNEVDDEGLPITREIVYAELVAQARRLRPLEHFCSECPANALQRPFGCQGAVNYPIRMSSEAWLMDQVQTFDTVAGPYLVAAFENGDGGIEQIRSMRAAAASSSLGVLSGKSCKPNDSRKPRSIPTRCLKPFSVEATDLTPATA